MRIPTNNKGWIDVNCGRLGDDVVILFNTNSRSIIMYEGEIVSLYNLLARLRDSRITIEELLVYGNGIYDDIIRIEKERNDDNG